MAITKRFIWVTLQKEGIHYYPAAATDPALCTNDYYDVSFLGHPHRHIFHFKVGIEVEHNDRAIEFIQFKRWLTKLYEGATLELNYKSCEMIAEELIDEISVKFPGRKIEVSVSEDNENGCELSYSPSTIPEFDYAIENIGSVQPTDTVVFRVPPEAVETPEKIIGVAREVFPSNPIVVLPNTGKVTIDQPNSPLTLRSIIKWLSQ
jgi:hypothetical protein